MEELVLAKWGGVWGRVGEEDREDEKWGKGGRRGGVRRGGGRRGGRRREGGQRQWIKRRYQRQCQGQGVDIEKVFKMAPIGKTHNRC